MLTPRAAAELLTTCADAVALRGLLRVLGFDGEPLPVAGALRDALNIATWCESAEVVSGPGALRACAAEVRDGTDAAIAASGLALDLAGRAAHGLWVVATVQRAPATLVVAVAASDASGVSMLVIDRAQVVDSDADAFCLLASAGSGAGLDLAIHARWFALLGREALNRRFYRVLERRVHALADEATGGRGADRAQVALVCSSRLLFLAFLQSKGWLDGDRGFLQRIYDGCVAGRGGVHRRVLRPLFFGTLNTPWHDRAPAARAFGRVPFLNGGLFAPLRVERGAHAPELGDASLGEFLRDVLGRYRFTASEERSTASGAAVDPEMLGRAFESLMASRERRTSGAFYTPSSFVGRVADEGMLRALGASMPRGASAAVAALSNGMAPPPEHCATALTAMDRLTVLDPACGSGAFLVHALERLATWRRLAGDVRTPDMIRRHLLASSIFGIDRDATAVWLCELRLWLAIAVECDEPDARHVLPLPNLDRNIRIGDALGPLAAAPSEAGSGSAHGANRVAALRARYARASGPRKERAAAALDAAERALAIASLDRELVHLRARRRDVLAARRGRDLFGSRKDDAVLGRAAAALRARATALRHDRRRLLDGGALPFRYEAHFADVMAGGGFGAVIGNPPWVRLHRIPAADRSRLREGFASLREAAWAAGAAAGGAGSGFAGQADLAAVFVERALDVVRPGGVVALLVPAKLWSALAGGGIRQLLSARARLHAIEDCTDAHALFDAVTYPSIVVAERAEPRADAATTVAVHRGARVVHWRQASARLAFDASAGSPWLLLPPPVRAAFDRLRSAGVPMQAAKFSRPIMGVKSGCNDAFIVTALDSAPPVDGGAPLTRVCDGSGQRGTVETSLLRPVVRGEHVRQWHVGAASERIIWTHDATGPLRSLPAHAARWLASHRARLAARSDVRGQAPWWALHRTEGADARYARVIWADMTRAPRAAWLAPGDAAVPLNTCYVLQCPTVADARAFTALFNSPLAAAWLRCLAEPARGGYRRLFAWTAALFPLPADWDGAREILAPLAQRAGEAAGCSRVPTGDELLEAALAAYGLDRRSVAPLFEWNGD